MSALPLIGPRVTVRRLRSADVADFQAYRLDPEVGRFQGWEPTTDEEAAAFLTEMGGATPLAPGRWTQVGVALAGTDRLIGDIGIYVAAERTHAELGFSLGRPHQGQGLATEAVQAVLTWVFEAAGVPRVIGITDARNLASARLLERVGMDLERVIETRFRGAPCMEHLYAVLRPAR